MNDLNANFPKDLSDTGANADEGARALEARVRADAHDLAGEMKHVGSDALAEARKTTEGRVTNGKDRVAKTLGGVADALRRTGDDLKSQDESGITEYVSRAADRVDSVSGYLHDHSVADVLGDVSDFARREPALFLGGAFVLGLFGGRFLKSSGASPARARTTSHDLNGTTGADQSSSSNASQRDDSSSGGHSRHINTPKMRTNLTPREPRSSYSAQTSPEIPEHQHEAKDDAT